MTAQRHRRHRSCFRGPLATAAALACCCGSAFGADLLVPGQFATIQAAINAAANGDVVIVSPGTYVETIDFQGKGITVRGTGAPSATVIDGGGTGPVVRFVTGEGASARLERVTVTGGLVLDECGAGVRVIGASPSLTDVVVSGNSGVAGLDLGEARGAGICVLDGSPTLLRVTVTGNDLDPGVDEGLTRGGGMWVGANLGLSVVTVTDSAFTGNSVLGGNGGGIAVDFGGRVVVSGTAFENNSAVFGLGGAVVVTFAELEVSGSQFVNNSAEGGLGGAIHATTPETFTVAGSTFTGNSTTDGGGGGAISVEEGELSVTGSTFTGNVGGGGSGGAISGFETDITVADSTFTENVANGGSGGGVDAFLGSLRVTDSTFIGNNAEGGTGGGASGTGFAGFGPTVQITRSRFVDNLANGGSGGGFVLDAGTGEIEDCFFTGNFAPGGSVGAVSVAGSGNLVVRRTRIVANGADNPLGGTSAGAVGVEQNATATLVSCLIAGNTGNVGSVVCSGRATLNVINCTVVDNVPGSNQSNITVSNSAAGSPATLRVFNSIVRGDTSGGRRMIRVNGSNTVLEVANANVSGGAAGTAVIDADPQFVDPAGADATPYTDDDDYSLAVGSTSIDAGDDARLPGGEATDVVGEDRVVGAAVDLGAFETGVSAPPCPGNYNGDGGVDLLDLLAFISDWSSNLGQGVSAGASGDYDGSGAVDLLDLLSFISDWSSNLGQPCP